MSPRRSLRVALLGAAIATAAACGTPRDEAPADAATVRTYAVRGTLESLPDPATGAGELRIRHEAIPDFVGAAGKVEPMAAMTMPFPVADGLDLSELAAGDRVRFDLRVDWQAARPVTVVAIAKLPAGAEPARG